MIVAAPNGGFGNRIRAIRTTCYLSEQLGMTAAHVWTGSQHTCAFPHIQAIHDRSFEYFFHGPMKPYSSEMGPISTCYSEWLPGYYWYPFQNYGQKLLNIQDVRPHDQIPSDPCPSFMVETSHAFIPMTPTESHRIYSTYCVPNERFTSQLAPTVQETKTIGISIRKNADFMQYFAESRLHEEQFIHTLQQLPCPIVLFSDDKVYQREMRQQIQHPVHCAFETEDQCPEDLAFLEFLTLSRCSHIFATKDSSFAFEAALFGGIPYGTLPVAAG